MTRIVFDNDDTIVNFTDPLLQYIAHIHGKAFTRSDCQSYDLAKLLGISAADMSQLFHDFYNSPFVDRIAPWPGMVDIVRKLQADGHENHVITARPSIYEAHVKTCIGTYFGASILPANIAVVGDYNSKVFPSKLERAAAMGASLLIDDAPHNLHGAHKYGVKTILVGWNHPWTKEEREADFTGIARSVEQLSALIQQFI